MCIRDSRFDEIEAGVEGKAAIYRRRIIFLMGMQTLTWDTVWTARRRGIYRPGRFTLRSGDGFGLTQSSQTDKKFLKRAGIKMEQHPDGK